MLTLWRLARDLGGIAIVVGLLLLVTLLPPDTSLSEVECAAHHPLFVRCNRHAQLFE